MNKNIIKYILIGGCAVFAVLALLLDYLSFSIISVNLFDIMDKSTKTLETGALIGLFGIVLSFAVVLVAIVEVLTKKSFCKISLIIALLALVACLVGAIMIVANKDGLNVEFGLISLILCGILAFVPAMIGMAMPAKKRR